MKAVTIVQGTAVPLDRSDVDTDQIIPSDWLKRVERTGFEKPRARFGQVASARAIPRIRGVRSVAVVAICSLPLWRQRHVRPPRSLGSRRRSALG